MKVLKKIKSDATLSIDVESNMDVSISSFHEDIKFSIVMAQFFGVMPLCNASNLRKMRFEWKSLIFAYSIFNCLSSLVTGIFCILKFALDGLVVDKTAPMGFYLLNFFATIQFIVLAKNWSRLLKEWAVVEESMKNCRQLDDLKRKCILLTRFFMALACLEHLFFILYSVNESTRCEHYSEYPVQIYFGIAFPHYFTIVEYSHWAAVLVEFINIISTLTWNFTDLFIILISMSLTYKFKQFYDKMENEKVPQEKFWKDIRENYDKLANLTASVDEHIAGLVMISFIHNIFFLCIQLYNSINERRSWQESVYFFYSFGFLVFRTVAVTIYAAKINESATMPLKCLQSLSSQEYSIEIDRLIKQITCSAVGITGSGFFIITKNFLLKVAGTIVTVELMIFQFAPVTGKTNEDPQCIK